MADHDTHDHTGIPGVGAPTEITDIPTADTTTTNVLAPDGAGGVEWRAEAASNDARLVLAALASTHDISSTTATEVSLGVTLAAGTYHFKWSLVVQSASTSVGPRFGYNFTGTDTLHMAVFHYPSTGTTAATGDIDQTAGAPSGNLYEAQAMPTYSTTTPNIGPAGIAAADTSVLCFIEGVIVVTVSGDLELWHGSEAASSTKVMAGSSLVIEKTA